METHSFKIQTVIFYLDRKEQKTFSLGITTEKRTNSNDEYILREQEKVLQQFSVKLKKSLTLNDTYILDYLEQDGVLTHADVDAIKQGLRKEQVDKLLDKIRNKGPEAFDCFVNSLRDDYKHLFEKLYGFKSYKLKRQNEKKDDDLKETEEDLYERYEDKVSLYEEEEDGYSSRTAVRRGHVALLPTVVQRKDKDENPLSFLKADKSGTYETNPSCLIKSNTHAIAVKNLKKMKVLLSELNSSESTKQADLHRSLPPPPQQASNNLETLESSEKKEDCDSEDKVQDNKKITDQDAVEIKDDIPQNGEQHLEEKGMFQDGDDQESRHSDDSKTFSNETINKLSCYQSYAREILVDVLEMEQCLDLSTGTNVIIHTELTQGLWKATNCQLHCFVYTTTGNLLLLDFDTLQIIGDPSGEDWFFPIEVSSIQIERLLSETNVKGCFYVYKSVKSSDAVPYNISLCSTELGDVVHYHINRTPGGMTISLDPQAIKFQNIQSLVQYFRHQRGSLAARLTWSPRELTMYKANYAKCLQIDQSKVELVDEINPQETLAVHGYNYMYKGRFNGKEVTIKTPMTLTNCYSKQDEFLSTARLLHQIKHKNIQEIKGVYFKGFQPYMVFDSFEKENLLEYAKNNKQMAPAAALKIFIQILEALNYLCSMKYIIHRDVIAKNCHIKAANARTEASNKVSNWKNHNSSWFIPLKLLLTRNVYNCLYDSAFKTEIFTLCSGD